ncbi:uncharacterized protein LOC113295007 [Papaver somniferum]|uniref:uncharacterized protein LOC113295007 n=1 Tax=Papaver somniferum TaxID=3469 RepID=UPI000E6F6F2E|nr:uncharacterized protein LOC113295007 [Papaver somniferum]
MEKIISPYQAAYVSGKLISDNTVITQEIIHSMKKKRGQIGWMCINTASLSVLNGSPCEDFNPTRGIRQGDPLSTFLFILATKLLSGHLIAAQQNNKIKVNNLLELFHNFSTQFGQVINFDKSAVHFSKHTKPGVAESLICTLGVKTVNAKERYLGSPLLLGHSKKESFKAIKENFEDRLSIWSSISLLRQIEQQ